MRSRAGARTWFVEEPVTEDVAAPGLRWEEVDGITRVWLVLPPDDGHTGGFGAPGAKDYGDLLADLLASQGRPPAPDVLVYTPLAHEPEVAASGTSA